MLILIYTNLILILLLHNKTIKENINKVNTADKKFSLFL